MSDENPMSKFQWAAIIVVVAVFLFSLTKCSAPNRPPSQPVSAPALKSQSPPREISPEQREKIKTLLAPFAGSRITTISTVGDEESQAFSAQLNSIFREAGWKTDLQSAVPEGIMPSVFLRVPRTHVPESKVKEFSASTADVTLTVADLPPQDIAVLKVLLVLHMDCPLETMEDSQDTVQLRIGHRP